MRLFEQQQVAERVCWPLCRRGEVKRKGGEAKREERDKHDQDEKIQGREQREEERKKREEARQLQQAWMVEKKVMIRYFLGSKRGRPT